MTCHSAVSQSLFFCPLGSLRDTLLPRCALCSLLHCTQDDLTGRPFIVGKCLCAHDCAIRPHRFRGSGLPHKRPNRLRPRRSPIGQYCLLLGWETMCVHHTDIIPGQAAKHHMGTTPAAGNKQHYTTPAVADAPCHALVRLAERTEQHAAAPHAVRRLVGAFRVVGQTHTQPRLFSRLARGPLCPFGFWAFPVDFGTALAEENFAVLTKLFM